MKHSVTHGLGKDLACKVAKAACESYASRFKEYNPTTEWTSEDSAKIGFSAKGITLGGQVTVNDQSIDLELDVPFLLRPLKGKAISVIEESIKEWIAKAQQGAFS